MRFEAASGLGRVCRSYAPLPLLRSLVRRGFRPLALLGATAATHPDRIAWRDPAGDLSYAEVIAELGRRRPGSGPVTVRAAEPRDIVLDTLAALDAGRPVVVLGSRAGTLSVEAPPRRGVVFLTSGTTGVPRAHTSRRGPGSLRPYLGMLGRLPGLVAPVVGSPSSPDHGHAFVLVLLTWALGGTYVAVGGPVGHLDVLSGVPVQLRDLLDFGWCGSARLVVCGSDLLDPALAARLRAELGAQVWDAYGSTETGPISLASPPDVAAGTVGRPLPGVSVRARDGVLGVRSPGAERLFRGDRGRLDAEGRIRLAGRADGRLVSGGEVVDPARLRAWLESQPEVTSAAIHRVPDARFGTRLAVRVEGDRVGLRNLRERIRAELGPAHVPVSVEWCASGGSAGRRAEAEPGADLEQ